jgi:hypothetical protein
MLSLIWISQLEYQRSPLLAATMVVDEMKKHMPQLIMKRVEGIRLLTWTNYLQMMKKAFDLNELPSNDEEDDEIEEK